MSTTEHTASESASTPETPASQDLQPLRPHACTLCQRRKVKCDRREPCANCTKARAECVFRAPTLQRRRPRRSPEAVLLSKLRRYEGILNGLGVQIDSATGDADFARSVGKMAIREDRVEPSIHQDHSQKMVKTEHIQPPCENGQMIVRNGKTRYLENRLWTHLSDEFMDASEILPDSSEDEGTEPQDSPHEMAMDPHGGDLLLGSSSTNQDLRTQHPEPIQGFRLWQAFLDNVNPITKILHVPTLQQTLVEATGNLDDIPKAMEALMFAIYACAVFSMHSAECGRITHQSKPTILAKYQSAARQALISAGFLKSSNIVTLQAYVLFLFSMRLRYDSHTLWALTGVATRLAQRIGLHRDGIDLNLSPFEAEMRRRLWWQIIMLEARAGEFSGVGQLIRDLKWTTNLPSNLDDSSLHPSMTEAPPQQDGATEMIHCLVRCEVGHMMRGQRKSSIDGSLQHFTSPEISLETKEQAIRETEELLQRRYLRFCNPSVPLHFVTNIMAEMITCKLRFRAYHPRHYWTRKDGVSQKEKDMLFSICVRIIELDNMVHCNEAAQQYLWHIKSQFQFDALIHVLSELRSRPANETSDRAWCQVDEIFQHHPEILTETRKGLHMAISRLAVRAWDHYERCSVQDQRGFYQIKSRFFQQVLSSRTASETMSPSIQMDKSPRTVDASGGALRDSMVDALGPPLDFNSPPTDIASMDWTRWDDLLEDFELNPTGQVF